MPNTATPATRDTFLFHENPALRTVEPDFVITHRAEEVADLSVSFSCELVGCDTTLGWAERGYRDGNNNDQITHDWHPYGEIQLTHDIVPTRFCGACIGWLTDAAELLSKSGVR